MIAKTIFTLIIISIFIVMIAKIDAELGIVGDKAKAILVSILFFCVVLIFILSIIWVWSVQPC